MSESKGFFLRMPEDARAELEAAYWETHQNRDEILLQGFAIWQHMLRKGTLQSALEKVGYQPKQRPERVRAAVGPANRPPAAANGQGPPEPVAGTLPSPDGVAGDGWDLDGDASDA